MSNLFAVAVGDGLQELLENFCGLRLFKVLLFNDLVKELGSLAILGHKKEG